MEAKAEEEHRTQHLDPEKLLYPAVDPTNTVSASMIQPDAGRVYTITGLPPKARKWKGSQLSLSDRFGENIFDLSLLTFVIYCILYCVTINE